MTTLIFSAGQLRAEKILLKVSFVVTTASANPRLNFSSFFSNQTEKLFSRSPKMVIINSGIGS